MLKLFIHCCFLSSLLVVSNGLSASTPLETMLGMMLKERNCEDFWFDNDYDYSPTANCGGGRRCSYPNEICMMKAFSSIDSNGINDRDDYKCKAVSRTCMGALDGNGSPNPVPGPRPTPRPTPRPQPGFLPTCGTGQARGLSCQSFQGPQCKCPSGQTCSSSVDRGTCQFNNGGTQQRTCQVNEPCSARFGRPASCSCPSSQQCVADSRGGSCRTSGGGNNNQGGAARCQLARATGRCPQFGPRRRFLRKFYFNKAQSVCQTFYWSQCQGNANRFDSIAECRSVCESGSGGNPNPNPNPNPRPNPNPNPRPQPRSDCRSPEARGQLRNPPGWKRLWTFQGGRCKQFWYAGAGGNGNRYNNRDACSRACQSGGQFPVPRPPQPPPAPGPRRRCTGGPDRGNGTNWKSMYYYNSQNRRCQRFWYGGSGGNGNRFSNQGECFRACATGG